MTAEHSLKSGLAGLLAAVLVSPAMLSAAQQETAAPPAIERRFVDPESGLSLDAIVRLGLRQEPTIQATRLETDAARHAVRQAALRANPGVTAERRREIGGMDRQWTAMVEWPLELFRRGGRVATATAEAGAAAAATAEAERALVIAIERQYGRLLTAVRTLVVVDELSAASRRTLGLMEARAAEGALPRVERDAAAVDAGRIEAERARAAGSAERELLELKRLTGLEPSAPLLVRETLEQAVARAREAPVAAGEASPVERADVGEALARVAVETARADQLRREARFDLSLFGGYMRMDAGFPQQGYGSSGQLEPIRGVFNNAVAGAMVTAPLFNRNQGAIAAAAARRSAAEKMVEARRHHAANEVASAETRVIAAQTSLAIFTDSLRETARRNLEVMREAHQLGRNTLLDVLAEQRRYLEFELAHTAALDELFAAQAELRGARGGERR